MIKKRWNFHGKGYSDREAAATTSSSSSSSSSVKDNELVEWEMRPGGMLVQKRAEGGGDGVAAAPPPPNMRVRVAYGALRYDLSVNSQTTFGELKKLLAGETGLQPGEQKLMFRGKERENGDYLDTCGVKDKSKVVLIQDPGSIERRFLEMKRNATILAAHRLIDDISLEVDTLAQQVSTIDKSICSDTKVPELQITTLVEMLMRQAVKLDSISAEGDANPRKISEGKRIQKCVETLDLLKESNARVKPVVVTTKWETFDPPLVNNKWEIFD